MQVEGWWSGQAGAQTSGGGATLVYFLGAGETGGMRPRTLICAAHHPPVLYATLSIQTHFQKGHSLMALTSDTLIGTLSCSIYAVKLENVFENTNKSLFEIRS